jgi:hypothetical protein
LKGISLEEKFTRIGGKPLQHGLRTPKTQTIRFGHKKNLKHGERKLMKLKNHGNKETRAKLMS